MDIEKIYGASYRKLFSRVLYFAFRNDANLRWMNKRNPSTWKRRRWRGDEFIQYHLVNGAPLNREIYVGSTLLLFFSRNKRNANLDFFIDTQTRIIEGKCNYYLFIYNYVEYKGKSEIYLPGMNWKMNASRFDKA